MQSSWGQLDVMEDLSSPLFKEVSNQVYCAGWKSSDFREGGIGLIIAKARDGAAEKNETYSKVDASHNYLQPRPGRRMTSIKKM